MLGSVWFVKKLLSVVSLEKLKAKSKVQGATKIILREMRVFGKRARNMLKMDCETIFVCFCFEMEQSRETFSLEKITHIFQVEFELN